MNNTVVEKSFRTPHPFVMYCIALRVSFESPRAVYFCVIATINSHAAHALLSPAQNWILQRDDILCNISSTRGQEYKNYLFNYFTHFILTL